MTFYYLKIIWLVGCIIFAIFNFFIEDWDEGEMKGQMASLIILVLLWPFVLGYNIYRIIGKFKRGEYTIK